MLTMGSFNSHDGLRTEVYNLWRLHVLPALGHILHDLLSVVRCLRWTAHTDTRPVARLHDATAPWCTMPRHHERTWTQLLTF